MDDLRLGAAVRAVRPRRGWRQADVAARAGVAQTTVSLIERGQLGCLGLATVRSVCAALEVRLEVEPFWRGGQLARLMDSRHAAIVDAVVAILSAAGWQAAVEYTFSVFGERGSVDVLAWRPAERALLIVEAKTDIDDLQNLLSVLDRKLRLVPDLVGRERGWRACRVGVAVVLREGGTTRDALARHRAIFSASLPARTVEVRRWIAHPGPVGLRGIWILRDSSGGAATRVGGGSRRVRARRVPESAAAVARQGSTPRAVGLG